MFYEGKSKRLPALTAFVQQVATHPPKPSLLPLWITLGVGAAVGLYFGLSAILGSPLIALVATAAVGVPLLAVGVNALHRLVSTPRTEREMRRQQLYETALIYYAATGRKKLHQELDPVAGQLLDLCAQFHQRIQLALEGPFWSSASEGSQWRAVAQQCRHAADEAMEEALLLGAGCFGKPSKTRKEDLQDALQDFLDLDFVDALQNLKGVALADSSRYAHHSPNLPIVFEPMKQIAQRLQSLAVEVERLSQEAAREGVSRSGLTASASIDLVLNEIRTLEQAEAELDQEQNA
jgi:hypothetical protein